MTTDVAIGAHCQNCGITFSDPNPKFCSHCGQETREHLPGFWAFLHEWITHYVALEGKLWRTLLYLFTRPGFLTLEYLAGRRERYIRPFRLYFSISLVFFLVVKIAGIGPEINLTAVNQSQPAFNLSFKQGAEWGWFEPLRKSLEARVVDKNAKIQKIGTTDALHELVKSVINTLPYALFLFLPIYAGILSLVYRNRRRSYGEHLIGTLNTYSAFFMTLLLLALIPSQTMKLILIAWAVTHITLELKRVYGGGWWEASWRGTLVGILSFFPFLLLLTAAVLFAAFS